MENKIYGKNKILYQNIHLKKLFDVLYQFSLRKRSAKAVSSVFFLLLNRECSSFLFPPTLAYSDSLPPDRGLHT